MYDIVLLTQQHEDAIKELKARIEYLEALIRNCFKEAKKTS